MLGMEGDAISINGDVGRHGIAIMAAREGIEFESAIESDCAPLTDLVMDLIAAGVEIHYPRDLTRGGLASALVEIAEAGSVSIRIDERRIECGETCRAPVKSSVSILCISRMKDV